MAKAEHGFGGSDVRAVMAATEGVAVIAAAGVEDDTYGAGWNGDTTHAPSQNAVYDALTTIYSELDLRCLESVFGTSISTGLLLDGTALKASAILQKYHAIDPTANVQGLLGAADYAAMLALLSGDAGAAFSWNEQNLTNIGTVGCDTITVVANNDVLLSGTGHVTSGSEGFIVGTLTITDGSIDDTDGSIAFGATNFTGVGTIGCETITIADGSSLSLQEDITFTGVTTVNQMKFPDNLANALSFQEATNLYMHFDTTNGSELIEFHKNIKIAQAATINYILYECYSASTGQQTEMLWRKSHNNTKGTLTPTVDGEELGRLFFQGVDSGSNWEQGARIEAVQNGAAGARVPTDLKMSTYSSGNQFTNLFVLSHTGNVCFGTATPNSGMVYGVAMAAAQVVPNGDVANQFAMYGADIVEGNTAPHFRTENGNIVKIYQQAHIVDAPGDTAANNATTINAILTALENNGLLASA